MNAFRRTLSRLPLWACLILACALAACVGGGNSGSETTNGLSGVIRDGGDRPVAGARVVLLVETHNGALPEGAAKPPETRTDRSGAYRFKDIAPGMYNLQVSDSATGFAAWIPGLRLASDGRRTFMDGVVNAPGSVEIPVPDFLGASRPGYLYLPGTTFYARVDSAARAAGKVVLEPVAPGTYPALNLVAEENDSAPLTLAEDVRVESGARTVVPPFASWAYSRRLAVSPTPGGPSDTGSVEGFPFLVRLTGKDFDFTQAAGDGRDLRFTGEDGGALPYQIERWDSTAALAEIWVRLGTLRWGDPAQAVTMHWGRPGATARGSGPATFAGYATVYHLTEPGNEEPGGYKDAGPWANHATAVGVNKTSLLDGPVGLCKSFAGGLGTLSAPMPPGLGGDSPFTVTFWMKASVDPEKRASLMHFGHQATRRGWHFLIRSDTLAQFGAHDSDGPGPETTAGWQNVFNLFPWLEKWTHVAHVYDPAARTTTTWLDGRVAAVDSMPAPMALDAAAGLFIGRSLAGLASSLTETGFTGLLDEVRFHPSAFTASRVRLEWATQRP